LQLLFVAVVASSMPHFAVGWNIVVQRVGNCHCHSSCWPQFSDIVKPTTCTGLRHLCGMPQVACCSAIVSCFFRYVTQNSAHISLFIESIFHTHFFALFVASRKKVCASQLLPLILCLGCHKSCIKVQRFFFNNMLSLVTTLKSKETH